MDSINLGRISELVRKKQVLAAGVFILALILIILLTGTKKPDLAVKVIPTTIPNPGVTYTRVDSPSSFTAVEMKAIEEQRLSDEAVGEREIDGKTTIGLS